MMVCHCSIDLQPEKDIWQHNDIYAGYAFIKCIFYIQMKPQQVNIC